MPAVSGMASPSLQPGHGTVTKCIPIVSEVDCNILREYEAFPLIQNPDEEWK